MARRKSKSLISKSTVDEVNTTVIVRDSDDESTDDEDVEDLANLASQVAKEMKNNLSPSNTRVTNLRNKSVSCVVDDSKEHFVLDKLPSNTEKESSEEDVKYTTVNQKIEKSKPSDNRVILADTDSSDDDYDEDDEMSQSMSGNKKREREKTEFERIFDKYHKTMISLNRDDMLLCTCNIPTKFMGTACNILAVKLYFKLKHLLNLSSALHVDVDTDLYVDLDNYKSSKNKAIASKNRLEDEVMKKSVLTPDFEKRYEILPYTESTRQIKKQRQKERDMTKGKNWFEMKAPEMTEELKNDLTVIQYRNVLDPKQFYKAPDRKVLPKYFQVGKVVDNAVDFYHSRVPKKQRKRTLVDELLADAELRRYNKKKYTEVIMEKARRTGAYRDIKFPKKLKHKKKKQ